MMHFLVTYSSVNLNILLKIMKDKLKNILGANFQSKMIESLNRITKFNWTYRFYTRTQSTQLEYEIYYLKFT